MGSEDFNNSIFLQSSSVGDLNFIADVQLSPLGVLNFLLQNPLVTLGVAAALYYVVPRAVRALVRWLIFPAILALVAYVVLQNPSAALGLAKGIFTFLESHRVESSAAIIIMLAFALSPYILIALVVLFLVVGVPSLPPFLRLLLPAPVLQVQKQASQLQQAVQGPLRSIGQQAGEVGGVMQRSFGDFVDKTTQPITQALDGPSRAARKAGNALTRLERDASAVEQQIVGAVDFAATSVQQNTVRLQSTLEEATRCRREPTPEERAACVARQKEHVLS